MGDGRFINARQCDVKEFVCRDEQNQRQIHAHFLGSHQIQRNLGRVGRCFKLGIWRQQAKLGGNMISIKFAKRNIINFRF